MVAWVSIFIAPSPFFLSHRPSLHKDDRDPAFLPDSWAPIPRRHSVALQEVLLTEVAMYTL
jgi:hypothetical protein